jgi:ribonuclease G
MQSSDHKQKINERIKQAMENDRAKHSILPLSKFGLMQITRQRVRPEMHISTTEKCPTCNGTGEISPSILFVDKIENQISDLLEKEKHKSLTLKLHPYVASYLTKGIVPLHLKWRFRFKTRIRIDSISSFDFLEYHLFNSRGEEILL